MIRDDNQQIFQQAKQADPEAVLSALGIERRGKKFTCPNPAHDDKNPSADFSGGDGKLWTCRSCGAGGDLVDFVKLNRTANALQAAEWIVENVQGRPTPPARNGQPKKATQQAKKGYETLDKAVAWYLSRVEQGKEETARYRYSNEQFAIRFENPEHKPAKMVIPFHRDENGWHVNAGKKPWPLYACDLNGRPAKAIVFVEGEKSADAINRLQMDYHAITTRSGFGSAKYANWQTMPEGLPVIIWPDADSSGDKYADDVTNNLEKAGKWPVKGLRRIQPPAHWPLKFDAADLIEQAGSDSEAVKQILKVIDGAKPVERQREQEKTNAEQLQEIGLKPATLIEIRPIDWIIHGHLAKGETTLILGEAGSGKTKACTARAAKLTRGEPVIDMPVIGGPQRIAIVSLEEDASRTIRPTLELSGADISRVLVYDPSETDRGIRTLKDLEEALERLARAGVSYCLVDSLTAIAARLGMDLNKPGDAYRLADTINKIVRRENMAVEVIHHVSKAGSVQHSDHKKSAGSYAVTSSVRSVLRVEVDPQTGQRFFGVSPGKNGLGLNFEKVMTFAIEKNGDYATASLTGWHPETIDVIAAKIARARNQQGEQIKGVSIGGIEAIQDYLDEREGLAEVTEVDELLRKAGFSCYAARKAKESFTSFRAGGRHGIFYLTSLPEAEARERLKSNPE